MSKIKLICFPYAGGSSSVYGRWQNHLHDSIQLCTVEFAGRGLRTGEPLYNSIEEAVEDIFGEFKENIDGTPYSLFGHSMGVIIIYELMKKINQQSIQKPVHIFLSGRNPPHIEDKKFLNSLPDDEFKSELLRLGGVPKELFKHKKLLNLIIPVLKADLRIVEAYKYDNLRTKWDTNISVLNGKDDLVVEVERSKEWAEYTKGECLLYFFEGGHFFIRHKMEDVISVVNWTLTTI